MSELKPLTVYIEGQAKFFRLGTGSEPGQSLGTTLGVTFSIPEGMDEKQLKRSILEEKERLDTLSLYAERARGAVTEQEFVLLKDRLKAGFASILVKKNDKQPGPTKDSK